MFQFFCDVISCAIGELIAIAIARFIAYRMKKTASGD